MHSSADIVKLKKQLLPTGRAFKVPQNGVFEKMLLALGEEEANAINETYALLSSLIPDNDEFTTEDATLLERTLGISGNSDDTLENRKLAIYRKQQFPSNVKGRQHKNYLEYQLQSAGFNCKIYEWLDVKNLTLTSVHSTNTEHGPATKHGGILIPEYTSIVANYIEEAREVEIPHSLEVLENCFWIAGTTFNEFFELPRFRLDEFRHIILAIKPVYSVALLRVGVIESDWILADGTWNSEGTWYNNAIWI